MEFECEPEREKKAQRVPINPSLLAQMSADGGSAKRTPLAPPIAARLQGHGEDVGVFDVPGIAMSGGLGRAQADAQADAQTDSLTDAQTDTGDTLNEAVPTFTVAKPGLKSAKKPKGRGLVSSVLGADGSIRQEQSRML